MLPRCKNWTTTRRFRIRGNVMRSEVQTYRQRYRLIRLLCNCPSYIDHNVTDWAVTSEVAAIVGQRSTTTRRRGVDEVLVECQVFHLETYDCCDGLATVMVNHYRTTSGHVWRHPVIFRRWSQPKHSRLTTASVLCQQFIKTQPKK